jgi:fucose permease
MPLALSAIDKSYYTLLIDMASALSLVAALFFAVISYPITVQKEKISFKLIPVFVKNKLFLAICFFLFFQSAFEALINNWSVSYFIGSAGAVQEEALLALSFSVLGMVVMRILTGSVMKKSPYNRLVQLALVFLSAGLICLISPVPFVVKTAGMFLIGAGLAPGFPVMLGLAGQIFKEVSATAFSFAMLIALIGNTIINYTTGVLIEKYGTNVFPFVILTEIVAMMLIFMLIRVNDKNTIQKEI